MKSLPSLICILFFSAMPKYFFNTKPAISLACISFQLGCINKINKNIPNSSKVISENLNSYVPMTDLEFDFEP